MVEGGVRIHYRRMGAGPGMVLLHGFPQTGHMWRKVMPALAERFTVLAPTCAATATLTARPAATTSAGWRPTSRR